MSNALIWIFLILLVCTIVVLVIVATGAPREADAVDEPVFQEKPLPSRFQIGDRVIVMTDPAPETQREIVAVSFTDSRVFYDAADETGRGTLYRVDSSHVEPA